MAESEKVRSELKELAGKLTQAAVRLALLLALLILVFVLQGLITISLNVFFANAVSQAVYILLLSVISILVSLYVYRVYLLLTSYVIEKVSQKPALEVITPIVSFLNKLLGLTIAFVVAAWLLSMKLPFLYGFVHGFVASFSGLASVLIAFILALQVKEIVGNYIAGLIIKASGVISEGDFIETADGCLRVEKINYAYTRLTDRFGEEIFIPNLRFLLETFRKPFSKERRRYVDLRFTLPYAYDPDEVRKGVEEVIAKYNKEVGNPDYGIVDYRLLVIDLANYTVVYELQVKPRGPVFPEVLRSNLRMGLLRKFGEDLAVPLLVNLSQRRGS